MERIEMLKKELELNEQLLSIEPTYELLVQRSYLKDMLIEELLNERIDYEYNLLERFAS